MRCEYCEKEAVYRCGVCSRLLCAQHAKLGTMCAPAVKEVKLAFTVHKATTEMEKSSIRRLVRRFWGEQEQLTFDRRFVVAELPAYVAKANNHIIGFVSIADTSYAMIVVALGVLPRYQGCGVGSRLIEKIESEAKRLQKRKVLASTSNDDLPALAFYQSHGFQVFEVRPNVIAEKHGTVLRGIGGLPVRDELRLQKLLG